MAETPHMPTPTDICTTCGNGLVHIDSWRDFLPAEAQDTAASSGLRGIRQAIIDAIALMGHVVNDSTGEAVNSALIADAALALAQPTPEPCYRVAPNPLNEYAVTYCETHDQPADQCHSTPEPSLRDALAAALHTADPNEMPGNVPQAAHTEANGWTCHLSEADAILAALPGLSLSAQPNTDIRASLHADDPDWWAARMGERNGSDRGMAEFIVNRITSALSAQPSEPGETA